MTRILFHRNLVLFFFCLIGCGHDVPCISTLNQIPEFGRQKKCKEAIMADDKFLAFCDSNFADRKEAAKYFVSRAWDFFNENKLDTSMFRFNQAWLLDTTNAE